MGAQHLGVEPMKKIAWLLRWELLGILREGCWITPRTSCNGHSFTKEKRSFDSCNYSQLDWKI